MDKKVLVVFLIIVVFALLVVAVKVLKNRSEVECRNGVCEAGENVNNCPQDCEEPEDIECINDNECSGNKICVNNKCVKQEEFECVSDSDCINDKICVDNECIVQEGELEPFLVLGADASRSYEPFNYLDSFEDAEIKIFGFEKAYWQDFETSEFSGYVWTDYDNALKKVEAIGGIVSPTIWGVSNWATKVPSSEKPASAPAEDYEDRYYSFIKDFMERYDNDGEEDMDGLKYAHNYIQIEDEAENLGDAWMVSSDCNEYAGENVDYYSCAGREYGEMLKLAYVAAHEANPNAKVISFSFNPGDFFDNNPVVSSKIDHYKLAFFDVVMTEYSDYFDILGLQCNYDYTGIKPWIDYANTFYNLNKPIICADAASMPLLTLNQFNEGDRYEDKYPFKTDTEILNILTSTSNLEYDEIKDWWESEKAKLSVKKAIVATDADAEQIFFQFMFAGTPNSNIWSHSDLLSSGTPDAKGTPRAVMYALEQLNAETAGATRLANLHSISAGQDPYDWTWVFKFSKSSGDVYVVWSEESQTVDLSSYIPFSVVDATKVITEAGENPSSQTYSVKSVPIGSVPLYVKEN